MADYIGAIDQGTTSTRFIVFDRTGRTVALAQKEHRQIFPQPGWVEHDPEEIWRNTQEVIAAAMAQKSLRPADLAAIGITNQRETSLLWNRRTGAPLGNAIVWQDTRVADAVAEFSRDGGQDRFRAKTGLAALNLLQQLENSIGCLKTSRAREPRPSPAICFSARSTLFSCGTSPAARAAEFMSPMLQTPAARN